MVGIPGISPFDLPTEHDLPDNVATWTVDPTRAVLLLHDMQRFFLNPFPPAASPRDPLIANAGELRAAFSELGAPVAYTAQPGDMTPQDRGLLADFWGPGMRVDESDRAVVPPLAPREGDWLFTKWRYSAFFRSDLLDRMREHGRDQLVLGGVYAHVGVLATAIEAFTHDIQPFVVADATADFSAAEHRMALRYVAQRCGVVLTTAQTRAQLRAAEPSAVGGAL